MLAVASSSDGRYMVPSDLELAYLIAYMRYLHPTGPWASLLRSRIELLEKEEDADHHRHTQTDKQFGVTTIDTSRGETNTPTVIRPEPMSLLAWHIRIATPASRLLICPTTHLGTGTTRVHLLNSVAVAALWALPLIAEPHCVVFNKECVMHRCMNFFSDTSEGYQFAGQLMPSVPLTAELRYLLMVVGHITGGNFNGVLANLYRTGDDYLSAHADAEQFLSNVGVVALSLGAARRFRIRKRGPPGDRPLVATVWTDDLELMWMAGSFQKEFMHEVPKDKGVNQPRLSLTFRYHTR